MLIIINIDYLNLSVIDSISKSGKNKTGPKAGMIITNEPGLYIKGVGGVRIEDILLVTKNGYKILTNSPKEFII